MTIIKVPGKVYGWVDMGDKSNVTRYVSRRAQIIMETYLYLQSYVPSDGDELLLGLACLPYTSRHYLILSPFSCQAFVYPGDL